MARMFPKTKAARRGAGGREFGQAMVEIAFVMPLFLLMIFAMVECHRRTDVSFLKLKVEKLPYYVALISQESWQNPHYHTKWSQRRR